MLPVKKRPSQTRVIAKSQNYFLINSRYLFFFFLISIAYFYSLKALGSAGQIDKQQYYRELENLVWMMEPDELPTIERDIVRLIQNEPYSPFAHYLLAHYYLRLYKNDPADMSKLRKTSELAQQAIDLDENSEYGYLISAAILDMMGYSENAARMVNPEVNTKISESWRTLFIRAQLLAGRGNPEISLNYIKAAMEQEPSAHPLMAPYVVAMIRSEYDGSEIISKLESWYESFPDQIFLQGLAVSHVENNDFKKAVDLYRMMTRKFPQNLDAQINQGILSYAHLGDFKKGQELLENSLKHPAMSDKEKISLVKSHLARIHLKQGQKSKARQLFREAISNSSGPYEWLSFSQQTYRQEKQYEELANLLSELKDDIPGSGLLYALHGEVLSEYLNQHDLAVKSYNDAILLEPEKVEYHNGLGLAYYRQKDMNRALATFTQAIKIDPRDAIIRYNEACILALLGRTHEALGSLREAVSLDPRLIQTARKDEDFASIRQTKQFEDLLGQASLPSQLTQLP